MKKKSLDLSKYTLDELRKLEKDVANAIKATQDKKRKEALAEASKVAKSYGYKLSDLMQGTKPQKRAPGVAKYAHPENRDLTWSGRGRRPQWIIDLLNAGKTLEELSLS